MGGRRNLPEGAGLASREAGLKRDGAGAELPLKPMPCRLHRAGQQIAAAVIACTASSTATSRLALSQCQAAGAQAEAMILRPARHRKQQQAHQQHAASSKWELRSPRWKRVVGPGRQTSGWLGPCGSQAAQVSKAKLGAAARQPDPPSASRLAKVAGTDQQQQPPAGKVNGTALREVPLEKRRIRQTRPTARGANPAPWSHAPPRRHGGQGVDLQRRRGQDSPAGSWPPPRDDNRFISTGWSREKPNSIGVMGGLADGESKHLACHQGSTFWPARRISSREK